MNHESCVASKREKQSGHARLMNHIDYTVCTGGQWPFLNQVISLPLNSAYNMVCTVDVTCVLACLLVMVTAIDACSSVCLLDTTPY